MLLNVNVPDPTFVIVPVPEIIPLNVWLIVPIERVPEFAILAEYVPLPKVPVTDNMPAEIVVVFV